MLPLLPILPNVCPNSGGLLLGAVRLWPVANVVRYPAPVGSQLLEGISVREAGNRADLYFLDGSASYEEDPAENEQGIFYKSRLQLLVPGDAPDVSEAVERLAGGRYLVAFQDGNGLTKLAGTKEYPLRLLVGTETGKRATDRNALQFSFAGELPARAPIYLEQEFIPLSTRRAWSAGFSFGFQ